MSRDKQPLRILHVFGGMNRGGAETWMMHVLRHIDRERFRMDFLVHTAQPCTYDDEIRALGSEIIPCPYHKQPLSYARNFKRALRANGPYHVVHSHTHHYSGYILRLAHYVGVPLRIAHSHSDTSAKQAAAGPLRRLYLSLMKGWIDRSATIGLACSRATGESLFNVGGGGRLHWKVLYYGIDLSLFEMRIEAADVRAELGIPPDAFVVGHVGRFSEVKNHAFLVDVAAEIARRESKMHLLLVGDGPLRPMIERKVAEGGLAKQTIFTGLRSDVPRLMLGAMDVLLLPSLYEGLPVVGVEAQAAGLPLVLSDTITPEIQIVPELISWLSLSQPLYVWAKAALAARDIMSAPSRSARLTNIARGPFNVQNSVSMLETLYAEALK